MPNIHLTKPMQDYADDLIRSGAYANLNEVVQAAISALMDPDGAQSFLALKAELNEAIEAAERGEYVEFDPIAYEPDAFRRHHPPRHQRPLA